MQETLEHVRLYSHTKGHLFREEILFTSPKGGYLRPVRLYSLVDGASYCLMDELRDEAHVPLILSVQFLPVALLLMLLTLC